MEILDKAKSYVVDDEGSFKILPIALSLITLVVMVALQLSWPIIALGAIAAIVGGNMIPPLHLGDEGEHSTASASPTRAASGKTQNMTPESPKGLPKGKPKDKER